MNVEPRFIMPPPEPTARMLPPAARQASSLTGALATLFPIKDLPRIKSLAPGATPTPPAAPTSERVKLPLLTVTPPPYADVVVLDEAFPPVIIKFSIVIGTVSPSLEGALIVSAIPVPPASIASVGLSFMVWLAAPFMVSAAHMLFVKLDGIFCPSPRVPSTKIVSLSPPESRVTA